MQANMPSWSEVLKVVLAAVPVLLALYNWEGNRRRSKLKDDLDIIKRYREEVAARQGAPQDDPRYCCLYEKIEHRMYKTYVRRGTDQSDLVTGVTSAAVAVIVFFFPDQLPFGLAVADEWRLAIVGLASAAAVFFFWSAIKDRHDEREYRTSATKAPAA